MTHKRFHNPDEALMENAGVNMVGLPDGVTPRDAAQELFDRTGEQFPVTFSPWSPAEPVVHTDKLPDGLAEADVEATLTAMKNDNML